MIYGRQTRAASRTAAAATAALILFWPAILLPILTIEQLGHRHQSSILTGTIELLRHGSWFVGTVVLLFSIVFPLTKIVLLLELSLLGLLQRRHQAVTYRVMELLGKWSMMDVMLLAFLVMLVKVGSLVEFHLGPAVVAFVLCVAMSMVASLSFDPHSIWDHHDE
jgi:paraquat-inducible protein A